MVFAIFHKWFFASIALFLVYFVTSAIYNLYFSPLAKYPGPFFAKISAWPNFYYSTTGYRHIWIWKCHQQYGDAVRFKPNGVFFNSPTAYQTIYNSKANVKRGKAYEIWPRNPQNNNTLTIVDKRVHAHKRRVLNSAFSEKAIRSAAVFVRQHVDRWNDLLIEGNDGKQWSEPQNMSELTDYLVFDIMGDLAFGKSFELKEPGENPYRHMPHTIAEFVTFMYPITQSPFVGFWVWLKPRGLDGLFERVLPENIRQYYEFVDGNVAQRRQEEDILKKSGNEDGQGRKDMFHYLFNATDESGNPGYTTDELNAEANLLIIAGSDTTVTTLIGFWFYIVRKPRVYDKLVEEIRTRFKSSEDIQIGADLSSCKYLQACIDESLRVAPAAVGELGREVLPGGLNIEGTQIPEGSHVGVTGWSIMHNEDCFGDPWVFRPERWIEDPRTGVTAEDVARARSVFNPFSIGAGNCVGQKLAMEELLITVAKTLYRMDVQLVPGDSLGGGSSDLGWGLRDKNHIVLKDAYVALRNGPMVQFRKRII